MNVATGCRCGALAAILLAVVVPPVDAGAHTWDVNEIFVNADGTIWFIELTNLGGPAERGVGGHAVISLGTTMSFSICITPEDGSCNIDSQADTTGKSLLFANQAFADLPGAPDPDQIVAGNAFFNIPADTIRYDPYDDLTYTSPLPTDGINSLNEGGVAANSPTNFAGVTGQVDASGGGGGSGTVQLTVGKIAGPPLEIVLNWGPSCEPNDSAVGVYRGTLASLQSVYDHAAVVCGTTASSTTLAAFVEDAYFLVVASGDGSEGSYGVSTAGGSPAERPQGASACEVQSITCP